MQISRELRAFYELLIAFLKSTLNLENFEKKISLIAQVLKKLVTAKQVAT